MREAFFQFLMYERTEQNVLVSVFYNFLKKIYELRFVNKHITSSQNSDNKKCNFFSFI